MKQKIYFLIVALILTVTAFSQQGTTLNFDGTNDQVNLGNSLSTEIDPLNTITVEAWVYPTQLTSYNGCIVGNYAYPTDNGQLQFQLRRDGTTYNFFVNDGASIKAVSAPSTVQLNTWTHIAGVWDGSEIRIYINGILQGTTSGVNGSSFVSLTNSFVIGFSLAGAPDEAFRGSIDEVRIWSSVRTQSQINTNKAVELSLPQAGLLRYYKFNNGIVNANNSGVTLLEDSSSNANNGTLINFALNGTTSNWTGNSPVSINETISGCWKNVYTGGNQTYAIAANGTLWSWGFNAEYQLGLGDNGSRFTPTQVGTANNWKTLSSGDRHVIALKEDGTLWAWGRNSQGHLGLGDTSPRGTPVQIGTDTNWSKIDCGTNMTIAIKTDGTLWVWGGNNEGQLGLGDLTQRLVPTQVGTATDWIEINGTGQGAFAIKSNGTLWGTGANIDGQLGLGDNTIRTSFVQIGTASNWKKIHGGYGAFTLAMKIDGSLWATGNNQYGQLGLNNTSSLNVFTQVGTATDWKEFTTANNHSMAIKNDKTLWTWGRNTTGQLGLGDNSNRLVPTQVGTATNWYGISGGDSFLIALNNVGEFWVTGNNFAGQLGLGDATNRNIMTQIIGANPSISPTFTQVAAICSGATLTALPTTSNNGVTGTWSPLINNTATTLYTFTPTAGLCASTTTMNITVNPLPTAPTASAQSFCGSATVASLVPASSTSIKWYNVATNGTALVTTTALTTGTYYVSTTNANGCESTRTSVSITINVIPSLPTVTSPIGYVQGATATALTATVGANGTGLLWYTAATSGTGSTSAFTPSTASIGATSYWVSSTNANGCESVRTEIVVQVALPATHLNFDGSNDYVSVGTSNLPIGSSSRTLETWVKIDSNAGGQSIVNYGNQTVSNSRFGLLVVNGTLLFIGENNDFNTNVNIGDNNWHHIAATYNGSIVKIYVDGILVGSDTKTLNTNNDIFNIGASCNPTPGEFFNGSIDEVRVWNVERSASQISGSKNCELQDNEAGLVAYYKFNQGLDAINNSSISTLTDVTANANNGTLSNFALNGATSNWLSGSPVTTGIMIPSAPIASAQTFCGNASVSNLVATGTGGTLSWYNNATNGMPLLTSTALISGSYYVAESNANGCESTRTQVLVTLSNPIASISVQTNVSCNGFTNGAATVSITGGISPYSYLWSNAVTTATATGLSAGIYNVTVTDANGCTAFTSVTISEPTALIASISAQTNVSCNGFANGEATISTTGGTMPYTYLWSNATTTETVTGISAGTYNVTVTDANGCTVNTSVTITEPELVPSPSGELAQSFCFGSTVADLMISGESIQWYDTIEGGFPLSLSSVLFEGSYFASQTISGCESQRKQITVSFITTPAPTGQTNQSFSTGSTLGSVVVNGSNIQWYDALVDGNLLPSSTVMVNGTTYYASQTITCESQRLAVTVSLGVTNISPSQCGITLNSYNSIVYANLVAGAQGYRFRVTNLETNIVVVKDYALRNLYLSSLSNFEYGQEYQIEVAVKRNGVWEGFGSPCNVTTVTPYTNVVASQCGISLASVNTNIYADIVSVAKGYRFRVTNLSSNSIQIIDRPLRLFSFSLVEDYTDATDYSIEVAAKNTNDLYLPYGSVCIVTTHGIVVPSIAKIDANEKSTFKATAYPNPFSSNFSLDLNSNSDSNLNIVIYDMIGKLLFNKEISLSEISNIQIGTDLPSGIYNVVVKQEENIQSIRMIKR